MKEEIDVIKKSKNSSFNIKNEDKIKSNSNEEMQISRISKNNKNDE